MLSNMTDVFYLAVFGAVCGVLAVLGGLGFLAWFVVNHVQIVW